MNIKHDTLNLSHEETDELIELLKSGQELSTEVFHSVLAKLTLLKEDHQMPPYVEHRIDPQGHLKWILWMLKKYRS